MSIWLISSTMSSGRVLRGAVPLLPRSCSWKSLISPIVLPVALEVDKLSEFVPLVIEMEDNGGKGLSLYFFSFECACNELIL